LFHLKCVFSKTKKFEYAKKIEESELYLRVVVWSVLGFSILAISDFWSLACLILVSRLFEFPIEDKLFSLLLLFLISEVGFIKKLNLSYKYKFWAILWQSQSVFHWKKLLNFLSIRARFFWSKSIERKNSCNLMATWQTHKVTWDFLLSEKCWNNKPLYYFRNEKGFFVTVPSLDGLARMSEDSKRRKKILKVWTLTCFICQKSLLEHVWNGFWSFILKRTKNGFRSFYMSFSGTNNFKLNQIFSLSFLGGCPNYFPCVYFETISYLHAK